MRIKFLGGTKEVGRISISVKTEKTQVLLDYGVIFNHEPGFPMHVPPKEVDGIILTHSHLDHSGAIPIFYIQEKKPLYTTKLNLELAELLIADFIHISSYYLPFEYLELKTMMRSGKNVKFKRKEEVGDIKFQLLNAGHVPGSAQILVEAEGKKMLYTGDFNTVDTKLLTGAKMEHSKLDALIIESTYADGPHKERSELENQFVAEVSEVVRSGGVVLVPAFGVGRSQEIACILAAHNFNYPVTIDGMTRKASRIIMNNTDVLRDPKLYMDALNSVKWIEGWRDRRKACKKPGVIISTAGMLKGGPAAFYISKVGKKKKDAVFLVSYQIPGTPGRELLDRGACVINGKMAKIKARVGHFDFSSHCGEKELKETVKKLGGKTKVYVVHGAEGNCELFANWINKETKMEATVPQAGDTFNV